MIPSLSDNIAQKFSQFGELLNGKKLFSFIFSAATFFIGSGFFFVYPHNDVLGKRYHILWGYTYILQYFTIQD